MTVPTSTVRLFQRAVLLWVIGFALNAYWGLDALNNMGRSPVYAPPGPLKYITHALALLPDGINDLVVLLLVPVLLLFCVRDLFRAPRWWSALLIWLVYVNLMNKAWLAGSGGQQLIANVLFWNILLTRPQAKDEVLRPAAFWIIRMQLLLAYAATGLHKLTGTQWLDGTAMGLVATDPAYGPLWIAAHPIVASITTGCVLLFQLTFSIAVWWRPTRYACMFIGLLFHMGTAIWMDIPEMGLAFIAVYPIWFEERDVDRLRNSFRSKAEVSLQS